MAENQIPTQPPKSSPTQPSNLAAWKFAPDFLSQLIDGEELDPEIKPSFFGVGSKDTKLSFLPQEFIDACVDINAILTELHAVTVKINNGETTMDDPKFFESEALKWNIQQKLLVLLYGGKDGSTIKEISTLRHRTSIDQHQTLEKEGGFFKRKSVPQGEG